MRPGVPIYRYPLSGVAVLENVNEAGASESAVVLQRRARAFDLPGARFPTQLPYEFRDLRQPRCAERMSLGKQAAGCAGCPGSENPIDRKKTSG